MNQPRHILERVERLYSYHQRSKLMAMGPRVGAPLDPAYKPAAFRIFSNAPKVALPTTLLDVPTEIYVAIFGLKDVDPGLYHFCPREFALRRLRDGVPTLMQIKKGRPDLEFLKTL